MKQRYATQAGWVEQALCRQFNDPEIWFPDEAGDSETAQDAKAICTLCPVKDACLEWALANNEQGIWGGMGSSQRARLKTTRRRATA
jgi:WhiB family redox-sensing transcriptional regulator